MRPFSFPLAGAVVLAVSLVLWVMPVIPKQTISRSERLSAATIHIPIPSYVAMDPGFYKAEGLDAQFVVCREDRWSQPRSPATWTSCQFRPAARKRLSAEPP